mmetsp:Transcript_156433/g.501910  ORF Transcript_156433/g.501910 Transcript_156433/m.501910 type:complete len:216 (+) Transcript_156433:4430-5077(+)
MHQSISAGKGEQVAGQHLAGVNVQQLSRLVCQLQSSSHQEIDMMPLQPIDVWAEHAEFLGIDDLPVSFQQALEHRQLPCRQARADHVVEQHANDYPRGFELAGPTPGAHDAGDERRGRCILGLRLRCCPCVAFGHLRRGASGEQRGQEVALKTLRCKIRGGRRLRCEALEVEAVFPSSKGEAGPHARQQQLQGTARLWIRCCLCSLRKTCHNTAK